MQTSNTNPVQKQRRISSFILTLVLLILLFALTFALAYFSDQLRLKNISLPEQSRESSVVTPTIPEEEVKSETSTNCIVTGCNGEICQDGSEEKQASICEYQDSFECYKSAGCEVQKNGECGWTATDELINCLNKTESSESK